MKKRPLGQILLLGLACLMALAVGPGRAADSTPREVRLAVVNIADDILEPLLADFHSQSGIRARIVYAGSDPFAVAEAGKADLVISHYGHPLAQPFVEKGIGLFPKTVFANQVAILGPPADPANIKGMTDGAEAIRRIAGSGAKLHTNGHGANYLLDTLSQAAGVDQSDRWIVRSDLTGKAAIKSAADQGAYIIWGVPPFLRQQKAMAVNLEIMVSNDPIFQRIMVSMLVNPKLGHAVNHEAARQLEKYLVSPRAQAKVRTFRYPGLAPQVWWPAGRHNSPAE